jgi:hypothetical protein
VIAAACAGAASTAAAVIAAACAGAASTAAAVITEASAGFAATAALVMAAACAGFAAIAFAMRNAASSGFAAIAAAKSFGVCANAGVEITVNTSAVDTAAAAKNFFIVMLISFNKCLETSYAIKHHVRQYVFLKKS